MRSAHAAILTASALVVPALAQSYDTDSNLWARDAGADVWAREANPDYYISDLWTRAMQHGEAQQGGAAEMQGQGMGMGMGMEGAAGMQQGPSSSGQFPGAGGSGGFGHALKNKLGLGGEEGATRPVLKKHRHHHRRLHHQQQQQQPKLSRRGVRNVQGNPPQNQYTRQHRIGAGQLQGRDAEDVEGLYDGVYARDAEAEAIAQLYARQPLGFNMREDGLRTREAEFEDELAAREEEDLAPVLARDAEADELDDFELFGREADPEAWAEADFEAEEY